MRIAIVGAGAVGCLFGLRLQESGNEVLLIHHKKDVVDAIRRKGVRLVEPSGSVTRRVIDAKRSLSTTDEPDLVLLTVKAYDTERAARQLEESMTKRVLVLSLQNGLGNVEALLRHVPRGMLLAGTTTEGALQARPGDVIHSGKGVTWIGELDGMTTKRCIAALQVLHRAGFQTKMSRNIRGVIWSKAIVNSAINPISTLLHVSNGELLRTPELRHAALALVSEGRRVASAMKLRLEPSPGPWTLRILSSTSTNKSSMLQDIESGRRTEIRQLNGWISAAAKRLRLATPYNDLLAKLVIGLETSRRA